jgi:hypothetical protein
MFLQGDRRITMTMTSLSCIKPGAKSKQIILAVDLSTAGKVDETLNVIKQLGYKPNFHHVSYQSGVHVLAVLKNEQHVAEINDDYLMDEWRLLCSKINSKAVHLWRGK